MLFSNSTFKEATSSAPVPFQSSMEHDAWCKYVMSLFQFDFKHVLCSQAMKFIMKHGKSEKA